MPTTATAAARTVQEHLHALGCYDGKIDGLHGPRTTAALRHYLDWRGLDARDSTLTVPLAADVAAAASLARRCLGMGGTFETGLPVPGCFGGLAGDFDQQGVSWGAVQWNLGQGTVQPLWRELCQQHRAATAAVLGPHLAGFEAMLAGSRAEQVTWAKRIQDSRNRVQEPWRTMLPMLGRLPEAQVIQVRAAAAMYRRGLQMTREYGFRSERAVAVFYDVVCQNGSIKPETRRRIEARLATLPKATDDLAPEVERLLVVAEERAKDSRAAFAADVLRRKSVIACGHGVVHGKHHDLKREFGITLQPWWRGQ